MNITKYEWGRRWTQPFRPQHHLLAIVNNAWIWVYKYLLESLLSIFLDIYTEVELLDYMVNLCLTVFEELPYHFSQQLHQFTFPPAMTQVLISLNPCQHSIFFSFLLSSSSFPPSLSSFLLLLLPLLPLTFFFFSLFLSLFLFLLSATPVSITLFCAWVFIYKGDWMVA